MTISADKNRPVPTGSRAPSDMPGSLFLQAFEGKNAIVPVWFMRQAGRYLPEYRRLKEKHSLKELFRNPELAAAVTCQPVTRLGVDAAILFADILTLPAQMGFNIDFDDRSGPMIENTVEKLRDVSAIHDFTDLSHVTKTIKLINQQLPPNIPLIGFAGSPFTVLTYLIEGGSSTGYAKTIEFMETRPDDYKRLMMLLTDNTIRYLQLQKEAGIKAFQLFDTWAGILRPSDYSRWVLPHVKKIFKEVDLPSMYYVRQCSHLLSLMDQTDADFLSVCHTVVLGHHPALEHTKKGIQGNLFNGLLFAEDMILNKEIADVLIGGCRHDRYIFNLSHGVLPNTDPEKLKRVVEQVHAFQWTKA